MRKWFTKLATWRTVGQRWFFSIFLAVFVALVTAAAGLVLGDLVPVVTPPASARWSTPARWIVLVLFLILLVVTITWREVLYRQRGTLYYVRLLDESMHDWHRGSYRKAERKALARRVITRWLDTTPVEGIVDARWAAGEVNRELQRAINDDDRSTGFHIAPNMLWPLALAVGYDLYLPEQTTLWDFDPPEDDHPPREFEWNLSDLRNAQQRLGRVTVRVGAGSAATANALWVKVGLTKNTQMSPPPFSYSQVVAIGVHDDVQGMLPVRISPDPVPNPSATGLSAAAEVDVHPAEAVEVWVSEMRRLLHEYPNHRLFLSAQASKTVVLAVGYRLANLAPDPTTPRSTDPGCGFEGCQNDSCRHPWRYLIPLNYDPIRRQSYPFWVRRDQSDPRQHTHTGSARG